MSASSEHGMDKSLSDRDKILLAIEKYSDYGSSIERKNLNIKWLIKEVRRLESLVNGSTNLDDLPYYRGPL